MHAGSCAHPQCISRRRRAQLLPSLVEQLRHPHPRVAHAAAWALGLIADEVAIVRLIGPSLLRAMLAQLCTATEARVLSVVAALTVNVLQSTHTTEDEVQVRARPRAALCLALTLPRSHWRR